MNATDRRSQEQRLPKAKADATLWECEELALRYLLEDGKLNLCGPARPAACASSTS